MNFWSSKRPSNYHKFASKRPSNINYGASKDIEKQG